METLSPQVKSTKKAGKKAAGKSRRAASLVDVIQRTPKVLDGGVSKMKDEGRCAVENCGRYGDHNIHHLATAAGYHEFTAAKDDSYETQVASGD